MAQPKTRTLGDALRARRQSLGLTAKELALRANVTEGAVSHIERGIRKPSAEMVARLASVLDCSVDELLAGIARQEKEGPYIARVTQAMKSFPTPIQKQVAEYCDFLRQQLRKQAKRID